MSLNGKTYIFNTALKLFPTKGNLVYEYNPFRNYRIDEDMIYYKSRLWSYEEFCVEFYGEPSGESFDYYKGIIQTNKFTDKTIFPETETTPVIYLKGQLVDFETDELSFSLNNPVNITPLWSYDNSVNLIINDGKNSPKLINSRFSPTERNKYLICDRKGNNDTNIYDKGAQFDIDTSLYRKTVTIPKLDFTGVYYGGKLGIGNYHFYFRYLDEDGNETDFFAESGLVSIFIGCTPDSTYSGFRLENSHKMVKFYISNTDPGYYKIRVYYTVDTSDILQNATTSARRIEHDYLINESYNSIITITGYENTTEVPLEEINPLYQIYGSVETLDSCLNMLFLANVDRPEIPYNDLADCALRFLPYLETSTYDSGIDQDYNGSSVNNYYDPSFIYNKVGYWDDEIYRFGIVFILSDNTLTPVFNVRGIKGLPTEDKISSYKLEEFSDIYGNRTYITYNEETFLLDGGGTLENAKGVVYIDAQESINNIIGINFKVSDDVIDYLKNTLHIKGYFFVRLKRVPTTLCLAYTIPVDNQSNTPVLPVDNILSYHNNSGELSNECNYITESFLSLRNYLSYEDESTTKKVKTLNHNFQEHLIGLSDSEVRHQAAICPDYDINSPFFNSLFTGTLFTIKASSSNVFLTQSSDERHFYIENTKKWPKSEGYKQVRILGVEDNTKLEAIGTKMFSARAGEAEEAFRYEYAGRKNKTTDGVNVLRGSYGPFLGITGYNLSASLIDIKIPGFSAANMSEYFKIRYADKQSYYAISYRIDLSNLDEWISKFEDIDDEGNKIYYYSLNDTLYRGDCYICQFTHRLNRNFLDPSSPTNSEIVDEKCWADNFEVSDGVVKKENFDKINLGDVNAVGLGMWVTFTIRSRYNLCIRAIDESMVDEEALFGHPRGFYPYLPMTVKGSYKIPEALCYNQGFEKTLSYRYNYEVPDVPWIKNEFSNRIAYSNILVTDGFRNGFRTFKGTAYRDYPKTYGSITKILELRGNLLCVFEHGVAIIPVNERALAGEGSGGNVYINTSNVLPENPNMISDTFGSQWRESVIKTPSAVYGVDTVGKKIWRTNGSEFEVISDFKIQEFLNNNISLTERELTPIIGVRNVKTHYNAFKGDVMFTFYDNLYGFEERVWNICYNEKLLKWITFYSWVPSYSENIYNQYFSFDRNTSKWIAKLGVNLSGNEFSDGITLDNVIITQDDPISVFYKVGALSLSNREVPEGCKLTYSIERDNYRNDKYFSIYDANTERYLVLYKTDYLELHDKSDKVILLNLKCSISVTDNNSTVALSFVESNAKIDGTYYESTIALCFKDKLSDLTTDFWKHGQAGIIDISDEIKPTYWYGKQHPFEFEFVVNDNPGNHKIFDNLLIISNKAAPESFHYEIIGECYDFARDKQNMYIRQEATKELYQYNNTDIVYDHDYKSLKEWHRPLTPGDENPLIYDKSTILPLYYYRQDTINEIEDAYHTATDEATGNNIDFSAYAGAEIVRYPLLNEYRIWNHVKGVDITKEGLRKGNMYYKEDIWDVLINPINIVLKNETSDEWINKYGNELKSLVPAEFNLFKPVDGYPDSVELPTDWERNIILWQDYQTINKEVKLKDKFIKIRIRYSGEDLAIISAIRTLYSISFA